MVAQDQKSLMNSDCIVKRGYLVKSPPLKKVTSPAKRWWRRWFVLYDPALSGDKEGKLILYYFKNEETVRKETPKEIDLTGCEEIVDRQHPIHGFNHVIDVVTSKRTFHLCADTKKEKEEWLQTLKLRVFNEYTMLTDANEIESAEITTKGLGTSPTPLEEWREKHETSRRPSSPSIHSSSSGRTSSLTGSSVFGDTEIYSSMGFGNSNSPSTRNDKFLTRSGSNNNGTRASKISNGSNASSDDGIVVTPRSSRWSWDRSSSGSASNNEEDSNCSMKMGFTGPKLTTDAISLGGNTPPQQLSKCRSMNNLTDNLTRLATEYDARVMRPSSDSCPYSQSLFGTKRGSRCASLFEEFQQLARQRLNSNTSKKRISESADETTAGDEDSTNVIMV